MSQSQELALLTEEIRSLFNAKVNELKAYYQLLSNHRFKTVRRIYIQACYKKWQEEDNQGK